MEGEQDVEDASQGQEGIRENGVDDLMVETRRRVKLFVLNDVHDWEDKGTGHVTVVFLEYLHGLALVVRSEDNGSVLLESRIESDRVYQKQDATLIVWDENDIEKALSFQEKQGCDDVWSKIREVQGRTSELGDIPDELTSMEGYDDDQIFHNSQDTYSVDLPACRVDNLASINELLAKYANPVIKKDSVVAAIENEDYVRKLLELFQSCEKENDVMSLQNLYNIFKNLFLMNRTAILQIMLNDMCIMEVIGCLEFDPRLPSPSAHRDFIQRQATFKGVIPITNGELLSKIHLMYKMQYIQDAILPAPSMFEENLMNALGQYILFQKIEIIEMIEKEDSFLMDLFAGIEDENTQLVGHKFRDLVFLLKEICLFSQAAQNPTSKQNFSLILWNNGLTKSLGIILSSEDDLILQCGVDILQTITEFACTSIQMRITTEADQQEEDEQIMNLLINILVDPHKSALDAPTFYLIKTLIDPDNFSPEMKLVDKTSFLAYLYKNCMHHLIAPFLAVTTDSRIAPSADTIENTEILSYIIQLLAFCVEQHTYHSRVYFINKNLLSRVVVLLTSRHSHLVLMTIRLIRKIIGMKEEGLNSYIVRNNLLQPVATLLRATPKYNMINSACLELFSFILSDRHSGLLRYVMEGLPDVREIGYVELFAKMQMEYDRMREEESVNPIREMEGMMHWSAREEQRAEERDQEAWFDRDDDVYALNSSSPGDDYTPMSTELGTGELPAITASPIKDTSPDSPTPPTLNTFVRTPTRLVEYEPDSDEDSDQEEPLETCPNPPVPPQAEPATSRAPFVPLSPADNTIPTEPQDFELLSPAKRPRIT